MTGNVMAAQIAEIDFQLGRALRMMAEIRPSSNPIHYEQALRQLQGVLFEAALAQRNAADICAANGLPVTDPLALVRAILARMEGAPQ